MQLIFHIRKESRVVVEHRTIGLQKTLYFLLVLNRHNSTSVCCSTIDFIEKEKEELNFLFYVEQEKY